MFGWRFEQRFYVLFVFFCFWIGGSSSTLGQSRTFSVEQLRKEVLQLQRKFGQSDLRVQTARLELVEVLRSDLRWNDAKALYFEILDQEETNFEPDRLILIKANAGSAYCLLKVGKPKLAKPFIRKFMDLEAVHMADWTNLYTSPDRYQWIVEARHRYRAIFAAFYPLAKTPADFSFLYAMYLQRVGFLERQILRQHIEFKKLSVQHLQAVEKLKKYRNQLGQHMITLAQGRETANTRSQIDALNKKVANLQSLLTSHMLNETGNVWKQVAKVQARLQKRALIEFLIFGEEQEKYGAFLVIPGRAIEFFELDDAARVDTKIDALLNAINLYQSDEIQAQSQQLAHALSPVLQEVKAFDYIYVAVAGAFRKMPLEVLLSGDQFLVERHIFSYVPSGTFLLREYLAQDKSESFIFANPDFGRPMSCGLELLPASETEARAVVAQYRKESLTLLQGSWATEHLMKQLEKPRLLHIATHGLFQAECLRGDGFLHNVEEVPSELLALGRTGLALAGANGEGDGVEDGILTPLEIANLDLNGTELVVASACKSGSTYRSDQWGSYGVRNAFIEAGAKGVLTASWEIPDEPAAALIEYFYKYYPFFKPDKALRRVKVEMINKKREEGQFPHPKNWAGFTYFGISSR
jgi:CHAT domain-containing protein